MSISGMNENRIATAQVTGSVGYSNTAAPPRYSAVEKAAWVAANISNGMIWNGMI